MFFIKVQKHFFMFLCDVFCFVFNVVFLFFLKHKRTKLQILCIFHRQISLSVVFDLYHNHGYIITFFSRHKW